MSPDPILYVDSDLISRLLNCAILRDSGYIVLEAQSFADACRLLQRRPKLSAIVTDIELSGGQDGVSVSRLARGLDPELPVIYLSGADIPYAMEGQHRSRFVLKPFDGYHVVRVLDDLTTSETRQLDRAPPAATP